MSCTGGRRLIRDGDGEGDRKTGEFRKLLQDSSLDGWKIYPRGILRYRPGTPEYENAWKHRGQWTVRDGVLEGRQDPPGGLSGLFPRS